VQLRVLSTKLHHTAAEAANTKTDSNEKTPFSLIFSRNLNSLKPSRSQHDCFVIAFIHTKTRSKMFRFLRKSSPTESLRKIDTGY
jgi:hypothetical protein